MPEPSPSSFAQQFSVTMAWLGGWSSALGCGDYLPEEGRQIIRHMVDVFRWLTPLADRELNRMIVVAGMNEHGRHAQGVRSLEILRHVLEHRGRPWRNPVPADHTIKSIGTGFRNILACCDVADVIEQMEYTKLLCHAFRVPT